MALCGCGCVPCVGIACAVCYAPGCLSFGVGCCTEQKSFLRQGLSASWRGLKWLGRTIKDSIRRLAQGCCVSQTMNNSSILLEPLYLEDNTSPNNFNREATESSFVAWEKTEEAQPPLDSVHRNANALMDAADVYFNDGRLHPQTTVLSQPQRQNTSNPECSVFSVN